MTLQTRFGELTDLSATVWCRNCCTGFICVTLSPFEVHQPATRWVLSNIRCLKPKDPGSEQRFAPCSPMKRKSSIAFAYSIPSRIGKITSQFNTISENLPCFIQLHYYTNRSCKLTPRYYIFVGQYSFAYRCLLFMHVLLNVIYICIYVSPSLKKIQPKTIVNSSSFWSSVNVAAIIIIVPTPKSNVPSVRIFMLLFFCWPPVSSASLSVPCKSKIALYL